MGGGREGGMMGGMENSYGKYEVWEGMMGGFEGREDVVEWRE